MPAGVCQTAGDRCDTDPQLAHLEWLTEVAGTKIGTWPVPEFSVKLSRTPPYVGGPIDRGAPCYGEDNEWVLGELLRPELGGDRPAGRRRRHMSSVAAQYFKACVGAVATDSVQDKLKGFNLASGFRITIPHPDTGEEYSPT